MIRITPLSRQLHRIVHHLSRTNNVALQDILLHSHRHLATTTTVSSRVLPKTTSIPQFFNSNAYLHRQLFSALFARRNGKSSTEQNDSSGPKPPAQDDVKPDTNATPDNKPASSNNSNSSSDGDKDKDDDDEDRKRERMISVFTKAVLWMATIYGMSLMLALLMPQKNRPETSTRYVSWHEFVHHMLATGEVRELIIRPDLDLVTIVLHDGAIVKGRQYTANVFHMAVADAATFEQKLRDVEKRLGVREGVTITYDRNAHIVPKLLVTLLITGAVFAVLSRMKGFKSPISMDSFVSGMIMII